MIAISSNAGNLFFKFAKSSRHVMAEAVVGSLLFKIGSALMIGPVKSTCSILTREASAMHNFFDEMEGIKAELESIQGFLHEAERFIETPGNIKNFIREIRTVAFDIEDIVDEFTYKLNEQNRGVVAKTIKRVTHVKTWYKLTKMLRKRKSQLGEIQKRKKEYDTSGIVKRGETQEGGRRRTGEYEHFKMEGDLTGIDENKKKLMDMLNNEDSGNHVISVWGMGGVGKTTLVTHVYNTIKRSFGGCAWIAVSQTWERDQLLREMLKELHREDPNGINIDGIETKDFRSLVPIIKNYLRDKRYLLILDDMWTSDVWYFIKGILPEGTAARIILTTRKQDVALLAPEQQIMEIIPLREHHSWDLFCKTAFKKNNTNTCPEELTMWARKIVEKCEGLPLCILAIGGVMACKEQTEREWKRMWEDLEHELEHNPNIEYVTRIIQLSFADLSCNLKNCLLYSGTFPEDYKMSASYLTNQWVAEGFVETRGRRAEKDVAVDYLNELVSRCLLQVVRRKPNGEVIMCRLHDIIHSMVNSKSKEEEFCVVHGSSTSSLPRGKVRRMSIQFCNVENASIDEYSLRSIFIFNSKISLDSLCRMLRSSKLLRVLDLYYTSIEKLPEEVFHLFNLHYLGLTYTGIKELPKAIGRLQNLQYLYAIGTKIIELPNELTKLRRLRVLLVSHGNHFSNGVMPPKEIWKLKNLQEIKVIKATDEMVRNFETLTKLTVFYITEIRSKHCEELFTTINKLSHLEELSVQAKDGEVLQLEALNTSASKIVFNGQVERTSVPQFSRSLKNHNSINELGLLNSGLDENSFSCLQEIRSLRILRLTGYEGNELCFHEMSFLILRELKVQEAPHLERIEINKGAMPNLEELSISECPGVKELPRGIEYLSKLELFEWGDPDETLVDMVQKEMTEEQVSEDRMRILRLITFKYAAHLQGCSTDSELDSEDCGS
ncbi:disease resistance protein RPM1-like [Carex rostrata]